MGDDQHGARIVAQVLFPATPWSRRRDGWSVRRAAKVGLLQSRRQSATRRRSPPDGASASLGGQPSASMAISTCCSRSQVETVHLVLELGGARRRLVEYSIISSL